MVFEQDGAWVYLCSVRRPAEVLLRFPALMTESLFLARPRGRAFFLHGCLGRNEPTPLQRGERACLTGARPTACCLYAARVNTLAMERIRSQRAPLTAYDLCHAVPSSPRLPFRACSCCFF